MAFLPNVTQVLAATKPNHCQREVISTSLMLRGKILHYAIKALVEGNQNILERVRKLSTYSISDYWNASEGYLNNIVDESIGSMVEVPLTSKRHGYRGVADLLVRYPGDKYALFEFKSSSRVKERSSCKQDFKQLAAYQKALRESSGINAKPYLCYLLKNSFPQLFTPSEKELDVFFLMFLQGLR